MSRSERLTREDIVYALDAIQNPMSLYEPIFTDGGDTLYVMDQIRDKKNREMPTSEATSVMDGSFWFFFKSISRA